MNAPIELAGTQISAEHYIGGRRVGSAETFDLFSPIDQRGLGQIALGLDEHVDAAVSAAVAAFPAWAALGPEGRLPYLRRFAEKIGKRAEALCMVESNDAGVLLSRMRH